MSKALEFCSGSSLFWLLAIDVEVGDGNYVEVRVLLCNAFKAVQGCVDVWLKAVEIELSCRNFSRAKRIFCFLEKKLEICCERTFLCNASLEKYLGNCDGAISTLERGLCMLIES